MPDERVYGLLGFDGIFKLAVDRQRDVVGDGGGIVVGRPRRRSSEDRRQEP